MPVTITKKTVRAALLKRVGQNGEPTEGRMLEMLDKDIPADPRAGLKVYCPHIDKLGLSFQNPSHNWAIPVPDTDGFSPVRDFKKVAKVLGIKLEVGYISMRSGLTLKLSLERTIREFRERQKIQRRAKQLCGQLDPHRLTGITSVPTLRHGLPGIRIAADKGDAYNILELDDGTFMVDNEITEDIERGFKSVGEALEGVKKMVHASVDLALDRYNDILFVSGRLAFLQLKGKRARK